MYGGYNSQFYMQDLQGMRDKIDRQIQQTQMQQAHQPPQPINNIINTNQSPQHDTIVLRVLNENEDVGNIYVPNKTFFMSDKNLVIKDADGKIEKFDIVKTYPVDPKDVKINELEQEIKELKELINNEYAKSNKPTQNGTGPDSNDIINAEPPTKTTSKSVSKKA